MLVSGSYLKSRSTVDKISRTPAGGARAPTIRRALAEAGPDGGRVPVATGEHVANRIVSKQLPQAEAVDFVQLDACWVGGVNENIAILLLAAKFGRPVCPHAGDVGLCELVRHLSMFDYVAVSGSMRDRVIYGPETLARYSYPDGVEWSYAVEGWRTADPGGLAISGTGTSRANSSAACNRTCSRRARPSAVSPPPSG